VQTLVRVCSLVTKNWKYITKTDSRPNKNQYSNAPILIENLTSFKMLWYVKFCRIVSEGNK